MKYLKYFPTEAEYNAFVESDDFVLPNVSYAVNVDTAYYHSDKSVAFTYNMVDLGLPSGLLWADRNVGASSPEDIGLYFAWGEVDGYTIEQFENNERKFINDEYKYTENENGTYDKYNYDFINNIPEFLLPEDDAATVHMGSEYRIPTSAEGLELYENTDKFIVDINKNEYTYDSYKSNDSIEEIIGIKLVSKINNNHIFIPLKCDMWSLYGYENTSFLWTSELAGYYDSSNAISLFMSPTWCIMYNTAPDQRCLGHNIRGVQSK